MAKLKLKHDDSFKQSVSICVPGGEVGEVVFEFHWFGQKKIQKFWEEVSEKGMSDVDVTLAIAKGWDLEEEFNAENIAELYDSYPMAAVSVLRAYNEGLFSVREKN